MTTIVLSVGDELFHFESLVDWQNHAKSRYTLAGVPDWQRITLDAKGRVCTAGLHFMQAEKDSAFPITVYAIR